MGRLKKNKKRVLLKIHSLNKKRETKRSVPADLERSCASLPDMSQNDTTNNQLCNDHHHHEEDVEMPEAPTPASSKDATPAAVVDSNALESLDAIASISKETWKDDASDITMSSQSENEDVDNFELEIAPETTPLCSKKIFGRRIVDINHFVKQVLDIASHGPLGCSSKDIELVYDKQKGLVSQFTFCCKMCNIKFFVNNDCCDENYVNLNCCAVAGTVAIGCGQYQLEEFTSCLNLPSVPPRVYNANHELVGKHWEQLATQNMTLAAEKEKEIAKEEGRLSKDGVPIIDVIADGCWSKRSYKKNYSAPSGAAAIIGKNTGQILYLGVRNKYCQTCARAENKDIDVKEHVCFKNYTGSSTGMESEILLEGFKSSIEQHGLIYGRLISDGDSSTYHKIKHSRPYPGISVEKIDCRNHVLRNFCNSFQALRTDTKYPLKHRKLVTNKNIKNARCAIVGCIKKHKKDSDMQRLFEDIMHCHLHAFGNHTNCKSYFCDRTENDDSKKSKIPHEFFLSSVWQRICTLIQNVGENARSLFFDVDSNVVENFHSVVAKFVGGKRINFSKKSSYQTRCYAAAVGFNTRKTISSLYKSLNNGASPQGKVKKIERTRIKKKLLNKKNKKPKRKLFSKDNNQKDKDYGTNCHKPDMPESEFEKLKVIHLNNLKKTDEERDIIQKTTILQSQSSEWLELRRSLLTASNFGKIIKMRQDTSCANTVKQLLYKEDLSHVSSIKHGRQNEREALKQLSDQLGIVIEPCGLFIDKHQPYLGATPDGLCGDTTIIEVKCPITAHDVGIEKAIEQKKVPFWKINKNGALEINYNHNWYYQVQGQLHITQRQKCIFAVWSNNSEPLKIEKILKDDDFWESKMKKKLTAFYMDCILPELIDPRHTRNMPIRDPQRILDAIQKRNERKKSHKKVHPASTNVTTDDDE